MVRDQAANESGMGIQTPWIQGEPYAWANKKEALLISGRWMSIHVSSIMKLSTCPPLPWALFRKHNISK